MIKQYSLFQNNTTKVVIKGKKKKRLLNQVGKDQIKLKPKDINKKN